MNWIPNIPGFIIEKLRELERTRNQQQRPQLEAPPPLPPMPPEIEEEDLKEDEGRGPVIIDMNTYGVINEDD